jgi:hypothetical protein
MARSIPMPALAFALLVALTANGAVAQQAACDKTELRRVVDEAGAGLRVLTAETQPRIQTALRRLKEARGWSDAEGDEKAAALMSDARTIELDSRSSALLARIDEIAETDARAEDCTRLDELKATASELQATVKAKSQHLLAVLEREAGGPAGSPPPPLKPRVADETSAAPQTAEPVAPKAAASPDPTPKKAPVPPPPPRRQADATASDRPPQVEPPRAPITGWTPETVERTPPPPQLPTIPQPSADGFSQDEIREASRGFFGTISSGLANVMEHAFSTLGRPTAYVIGSEGGGAFIAGLRYGKGTLVLKDGGKREVFWHGPSIGYDFGASGAKTMFLVYNLKNEIDIFTGFSGVEGSAYLVGGVGMTLMTDGRTVMAPIRSGVGLRLGASIGYIRFTARPTWNPF